MDRLRKLILRLAFETDIHRSFIYWSLSRLSFSRFGGLKDQEGRSRAKIGADQVRRIIEEKQIGANLKKNIFCDEFTDSAIDEQEINFLVGLGSANDTVVRDKAITLLIEFGRRDPLVSSNLLNKLKVSIDEFQCKAIMLVFVHLSSFEPLAQFDKELVGILLQRIRVIHDPYKVSSIPTAQGLLTTLVADNKMLLPLLFDAFEKSADEHSRRQYVTVLQSIALRNRLLVRQIADWTINHRASVSNLEDALQELELKNDPRTVASSIPPWRARRSHTLVLSVVLFTISALLLNVYGVDLSLFAKIQYPMLSFNPQHVSGMLDLVLKDNIFLVGLVVAISIFAMRELYSRFGSDLLVTFLTHKIRLIILGVLFTSFLSTGVCLAMYYQDSPIPAFLLQFSILSLYLNPFVFILWCITVVYSLRPRVAMKQYVVARQRVVTLLSNLEADLTKRLVEVKEVLPSLRFVFDGVAPNPSRNQFTVNSEHSGILTEVDSDSLQGIHDLLVTSNEAFEKYGKTYMLSELQLHRRVGIAVNANEALATFYSDDIRLIRRLEDRLRSMFRIGFEKEYQAFREIIDTIFFALENAIKSTDVGMHGFLLSMLTRVFSKLIERKSRHLHDIMNERERPKRFSFLESNEATFMEVYLFKAASKHARLVFSADNSFLSDQFNDFVEEVIRISQTHRLYTSVGLVLSSFNEAQNWLIESKQYKDLRLAFIQKGQLASICYANEDESHDTFLRLDFQNALSKVFSSIDEEPEINHHVDNYFTSYENFVCYMMVVRYFNGERVSRCFKWIHEFIEEHKSHHIITFFGMRTMYMIGALCLVRERFSLASEGALHLVDVEKLTGVKIDSVVKFLTRNKYDLGLRNSLWGGLFNPSNILDDIGNYAGFVRMFSP